MSKIGIEHIQQQSEIPSAIGVPQYGSDTTTTTTTTATTITDEEQSKNLHSHMIVGANTLGKPNLRAAFLNSSLREVMELMRPANVLHKHAPTLSDRLSDAHHVFIIEEKNGKPLFELTPGCVLELCALPAKEPRVLESRTVRTTLRVSKQKTCFLTHAQKKRSFRSGKVDDPTLASTFRVTRRYTRK